MSSACETYTKEQLLDIIASLEAATKKRIREKRIRNFDYSVTLPKKLRDRVAKVIRYEYTDSDENVFMNDGMHRQTLSAKQFIEEPDDDEQQEKEIKEEEDFNSSTCSEIEVLEAEFEDCILKLPERVESKITKKKTTNIYWASKYICQKRKERVKWESKTYDTSVQKTLDEQAQELMDASAERFTEWVNSLGSNSSENMSKETLKALFNIEGDKKLFASIQTDPKEVKAIAKTVADKWKLPEMALELKYERYIDERLKNIPKTVNLVAFGRCIPLNQRPWIPADRDKRVETVYPPEILSGEKLFRGIGHLRSTKAIIEFYRTHPNLKKPSYIQSRGYFNQKAVKVQKSEVPLYELLKLKY